jgi:hypothetical protein
MAGHDKLDQPFFSRGGKGLNIVFKNSLERLLRLPLRMLRCQRLDPVDGEKKLEIGGLLRP